MARDPQPRRGFAARRAVAGAGAALPLLTIVVLGAAGPRPRVTGAGTWTTPLQVLLGIAGLAMLAVVALVLRNMGGGTPQAAPPRWSRLLVGFALLLVAIVALPLLDVPPPEPVDAGLFGLEPVVGTTEVAPRPTSAAAVTAGLTALLATVVIALLLTQRGRRPAASPAGLPPEHDGTPVPDLEGSPTEVVLAAYARARSYVVRAHGAGTQDPPGRLLARVAGTGDAEPLRALTELYLPVRYGRQDASQTEAAAALAALARLTATTEVAR